MDVQDAFCTTFFHKDILLGTVVSQDNILLDPCTYVLGFTTEESVGSISNMTELLWGIHRRDSSSDESSSNDSSSITNISNNDQITTLDTSRAPPKAGGAIVETCGFVCVMCLTFCELASIAYLNLVDKLISYGYATKSVRRMDSSPNDIIWLGDD